MAIQVNRTGGPDPVPPRSTPRASATADGSTGAGYGADSYVPSTASSTTGADDASWVAQKQADMLQGKILAPKDAARYYRLTRGQTAAPAASLPAPADASSNQPPAQPTAPSTDATAPAATQPAATPAAPAGAPSIPGLSADEVAWVQNLAQKVQGGYQPTADEVAQYKALSQKAAAAQAAAAPATAAPASTTSPSPAPATASAPPPIPGLTPDEVSWVQQLAAKVKGGYQPTADELTRYQGLVQRAGAAQAAAAPAQPAATTPATATAPSAPTAPAAPALPNSIPGLTADEVAWVQALAKKVQSGQQPTADEVAKYQALSQKANAAAKAAAPAPATTAPAAATSPAPAPVAGGDDASWSAALEAKVQQGYTPTPDEIARYQHYKGLDQPAAANNAPAPAAPAPTVAAPPPAGTGQPSPQEMQWASALEAKVQQGYTPTLTEVQTYQSIRQRGGSPVGPAPTAPAAPAPAPAYNTYTPFVQQTPATPPAPPANAPAIPLTKDEMTWALGFEQQLKVGYQPSAQELQAYEGMKARYKATAPDPSTLPLYTDQELQWAQTIEKASAQGYQPAPNEAAAYQDIKRRFLLDQQRKAAPAPATPNAPLTNASVSSLELQWANMMKNRIQSGYQPTPQEAQAIQDIARRLVALQQAAGGGNAPVPTTATAPLSPQEQQYSQVNWQQWSQPIGTPDPSAAAPAPAAPAPTPAIVTQLPTITAPPSLQPINADGKPLPTQAPTPQEMQWATQLEQRVQQGYQPTPQEIQQHDDIYRRYQTSKTSASGGFFSKLKQGFQNLIQKFIKPPAPAAAPAQ